MPKMLEMDLIGAQNVDYIFSEIVLVDFCTRWQESKSGQKIL